MSPSRPSSREAAEIAPVIVTERMLRACPLPRPAEDADKEERGRVLVAGGSPEMPGAAVLAATAALRAGAGKLRLAVPRSVAPLVAAAVPEARVFAMPETLGGALDPEAAEELAKRAEEVDAILIGPGLADEDAIAELLSRAIPRVEAPALVLDAAALALLKSGLSCLSGRKLPAVVTPHAGEMAALTGRPKAEVLADPAASARRAAAEWDCVVALKGPDTWIATPDGRCYLNRTGNVGLATSGSGDTLAGLIAGLAARGTEPLAAAVWGVALHARAGDRLARRLGRVGFLARELLAEVPRLMQELAEPRKGRRLRAGR